ncbi:uncharacterized protein BYT42DRAFT_564317 [Radiomyces spectabilis]|uniref:uncharacterized protein n=1 Tax=Radiomyces spectabilis TaxID=64574 RepID=UPI00221F4BE3|nr:uncharacterized protein BYT42DRAFT_564317 [Radiomyces spectabilis]KAI8384995.1 hypothetical protein BYT42DRAFT_564317 [Radiomyces spectabilis]
MSASDRNNGPKWKREVVQDHKFDFVDLDEFYDPSCRTHIGHLFVYVLAIKSFLVYVADLWSGVSLLVIGHQDNVDPAIPTEVSKWVFLSAIIISFILLFWDAIKARRIIASRDIAYAFTSVMVNRYYSIKDYQYYCLFTRISRSRKTSDDLAFFIFFTLKGWKRLLLAEAPRQIINVVTLQSLIPQWIELNQGKVTLHNTVLGHSIVQQLMTGTMLFSVIVFAISFILVLAAAVLYIPLLCHIRGNLKEYCCHKVDKRIAEILKQQARRRLERGQKGLSPQNRKKAKQLEADVLPEPTLPQLDIDNEAEINSSFIPLKHAGLREDSINSMPMSTSQYDMSIADDRTGLISHAQTQPMWSNRYEEKAAYQDYYELQRPTNNHATMAYPWTSNRSISFGESTLVNSNVASPVYEYPPSVVSSSDQGSYYVPPTPGARQHATRGYSPYLRQQ